MRESEVEKYLCKLMDESGGLCDKLQGAPGLPDRLCTFPNGYMKLVEVKTETGRLSPRQTRDHERRARRKVFVAVLWSKADVDEFMRIHADYCTR